MTVCSTALTDAYRRLGEALPFLTVTELAPGEDLPSGGGWTGAARLARDGAALDAFLAHDDEQVLRDHGRRARPDVIASFGLHRYAWPAVLLITAPWFLERRVPRLPLEAVAVDRGGQPARFAVRPDGFACLPDDPAAGLPEARVVPGEEALRDEVRRAVAAHMEPLLAVFGPRMRRRTHALWAMVTDEIVESLMYLAELLGPEETARARRELELLLPGQAKPYVGTPAFRELTGPHGETLPTRDRASCCMYYTLDPQDTCVTCPRTRDPERVVKLLAQTAGCR
jgi:hypothetical protein